MDQQRERAWRANILPRELRRQAASVAHLAQSLAQAGDYPTGTPPKLCQLICATAKTLGDNISAAPLDQLRHVNEFLRELALHLRFADRSRIEHTPWSMVHATESVLKRQIGDDAHFIIGQQWNYNYVLVADFFTL